MPYNPPPPPPKKGQRMGTRITTIFDGKEVNLEDAFETLEEIFESAEEVFENMEKVFSSHDTKIKFKVNELKKRIAAQRPDEFEYIPDEDEVDWDPRERIRVEQARFRRSLLRTMILTISILAFISVISMFASIISTSNKETKVHKEAPMQSIGEQTSKKGEMGTL